MRRLCWAALAAAALGCARLKGSPLVPMAPEQSRFAVFAGVPSDAEPILVQRGQERAQEEVLRELSALLRARAGERFVENAEVVRLYGKNFLPIPSPLEKRPRFDVRDPAQHDACKPLTAAHVRGRLGVDVFAVAWVLADAPAGEPDAPAEAVRSQHPPLRGPYFLQLFSATDCRSLGFWELSLSATQDFLARLGDRLPRAAAQRLADALHVPLRL